MLTITKVSFDLKRMHFSIKFSPKSLETRSMIHVLKGRRQFQRQNNLKACKTLI
jgi:hypothetical protein